MCIQKLVRHLLKVFHGFSKHRWPRETCRFQNVVSSGLDQRTSHEHRISQRIQAAKFADRIENQHVNILSQDLIQIQLTAAQGIPSSLSCDFFRSDKSVGLSRCEYQQSSPPLTLARVVSRQDGLFFSFNHTAGHQHRPALLLPNLRFQPCSKLAKRCGRNVILHIACNLDALLRGTHAHQTRGVIFGLRQEKIRILQRGRKKLAYKKSPTLETTERPVRDARVRENHGYSREPRFPQKIGPYFRLHHDHKRGTNRAQRLPDRHYPIKRKIKNTVGGFQPLASQPLPRFRGGRNEDRPVRKLTFEFLHERFGRQNLAHRYCVYPNCRASACDTSVNARSATRSID